MGNWNINIQGVGMHHNGKPQDANEMAKKFAESLKEAGHHIEHATFTNGGKDDLASSPKT